MSVNEKMKAIADAIRAITGGTEQMTLDGMAEAIAGINASGKVATGEYTYTGGSYKNGPIAITHGLGVKPDYVFVFAKAASSAAPNTIKNSLYAAMYQKGDVYTIYRSTNTSGNVLAANVNDANIKGVSSVGTSKFSIGGTQAYPLSHTYAWMAFAGVSE